MNRHKSVAKHFALTGVAVIALTGTGCATHKAASAASKGDLATLQALHQEGKNLDGKSLTLTTPLFQAIESSNLEVARFLIDDAGANVNEPNGIGKTTALMVASRNNDEAAMTLLLEAGADPDLQARNGDSALHLALRNQHRERIGQLLAASADPDLTDKDGTTPLMMAQASEDAEAATLLINAGADLEIAHQDDSALMRAVKADQNAMISLLLEAGADPNTEDGKDYPAILYAVHQKNRSALGQLLNRGADANAVLPNPYYIMQDDIAFPAEGGSLLAIATRQHWKDGVLLLLEADAQPDLEAMRLAAISDKGSAILAQMLAAGAQPDGDSDWSPIADDPEAVSKAVRTGMGDGVGRKWTPLTAAMKAEQYDNARLLLAAGADPSPQVTEDLPPLYYAADQGNTDMVAELLAAGAEVDQRTPKGFTSLYQTAWKGQTDTFKQLLAAGADINSVNGGHYTPLMGAADNEHKEIVLALLAAGADPNIQTKDGYTALFYAVGENNKDITGMLMAGGADPSLAAGSNRWTPAHKAAHEGYYDTLEQLLKLGANANAGDIRGDTPMDKAMRKNYQNTPKVLARYGGRINNYTPPEKKSSGFETMMKVAVTASVAAAGAQADIPSQNYADVMSATIRDVWIEDGKGTNMAQLYQQYARGDTTTIRDPLVQQVFSASMEAEQETARLQQQLAQQQAEQRRQQQVKQQALQQQQAVWANEQQRRQQQLAARQQAQQQAQQQAILQQQQRKAARQQAQQSAQPMRVGYTPMSSQSGSVKPAAPVREPQTHRGQIRTGTMMGSDSKKLDCPSCKGTLTRNNLTVGECRIQSITVAYDVGVFFGEPLVKGDYKWQAAAGTPDDCLPHNFAVWLRIENQNASGYVEIDPVVPKSGSVSFSGTAGSPNWDNFICGFEGNNRNGCFGTDDAKTLLKKGRITGFELSLK